MVKYLPAKAGDVGVIPGWSRIPWIEESWWATVDGVAKESDVT